MNCPKCGGPSIVMQTRKLLGAVWRRRICDKGHRFSTHQIADKPEALRTKDLRATR
jgi:transcriptional regulator NrdR family protein